MEFQLTEEQLEIKQAVREFCEKEFTPEAVERYCSAEEFPWDIYKKAGQRGFIGIHYPEEYGGQGLGVLENALVTEEIIKKLSDPSCDLIIADEPEMIRARVVLPAWRGPTRNTIPFSLARSRQIFR